ncbi:restriction endonuclease subunit S [Faunimonas sp. B44]|uniref:restriction endonuclease subunit S n=1 Tax=Faunimonas sp. B44 TaxID=3461493 RepID=UPI0040443402
MGDGLPFLMASDFEPDGRINFEKCARLTTERAFNLRLPPSQAGDVLLTHKGSVGRVARLPSDVPVAVLSPQVTFFRLRPDRLDPGYFVQALRDSHFQAQLETRGVGTTRQYISLSAQEQLAVPVPPIQVQHRIAGILSAYDDLIENNTRRIAILEEMARRLYEEWFVHFRFPGHEEATFVETAHGRLPEQWEHKPFSAIADFVNGYAFKPSDWGEIGDPIIKIRELKAGVKSDTPRYARNLPEKFRIRDGDLLFSWSADLEAYLWQEGDAWLNQHLFHVQPRDGLPTSYVFLTLRTQMGQFRVRSAGTTMRHIKRSALDEVQAVVADRGLMEEFDTTASALLNLGLNLKKECKNLRAQRDLLLPKLVSGEIDVSAAEEAVPVAAE